MGESPTMPTIASVGTALPPHEVRQEDARAAAASAFQDGLEGLEGYLEIFDNAGVARRRVAAPLPELLATRGWRARNRRYVEAGDALAAEAARAALERAGLAPEAVDAVVLVSSTGVATPSLDARLAHSLPLREDVVRLPLWGLGCAGGVAGVNRAGDLARAHPQWRVLLVCLELCSLQFLRDDVSLRNLVAASLFGDGAAAAVVAGDGVELEGPRLAGGAARLWPDSLDVMGWDVEDEGLAVVFSRRIPELVREGFRPHVEAFLKPHGLAPGDVDHLALHPGGAKVIAAYREALGLPEGALEATEGVLRDHGNMSSPTALFVLDRVQRERRPGAGETGLLAAWGPGFSGDLALLEW